MHDALPLIGSSRILLPCLWVAASVCPGCGSDDATLLAIDLVTDLPEGAFALVRTEATGPGGASHSARWDVPEPFDPTTPPRIAEFTNIPTGSWRIQVDLVSADGALVLSRTGRFHVTSRHIVRIVLTRDCLSVSCAEGERPACLGARCVPEDCLQGNEPSCPPLACHTDDDCRTTPESCLGRCRAGTCLQWPTPGTCPSGQRCDADGQCTASPGMDGGGIRDAQPDAPASVDPDAAAGTDAGREDSGCGEICPECNVDADCNDGNPCTLDECIRRGICAHRFIDRGSACGGGNVCDGSGHCVQCVGNSQCSGITPYCVANSCVQCRSPIHCNDANPCTDDRCMSNACSNPFVPRGSACGGGRVCDGSGHCVQCVGDSQCSGATPYCDTTSNTCVECIVDTHCRPGEVCFFDGVCRPDR